MEIFRNKLGFFTGLTQRSVLVEQVLCLAVCKVILDVQLLVNAHKICFVNCKCVIICLPGFFHATAALEYFILCIVCPTYLIFHETKLVPEEILCRVTYL